MNSAAARRKTLDAVKTIPINTEWNCSASFPRAVSILGAQFAGLVPRHMLEMCRSTVDSSFVWPHGFPARYAIKLAGANEFALLQRECGFNSDDAAIRSCTCCRKCHFIPFVISSMMFRVQRRASPPVGIVDSSRRLALVLAGLGAYPPV